MNIVEENSQVKHITFYYGEEPIGGADIEIIDDEIWLNHFAIREDMRGYGYGQRALKLAIEKYAVNTLTCDIENKIALHIYMKHGFNIIDSWLTFDDGEVYLMKRVA